MIDLQSLVSPCTAVEIKDDILYLNDLHNWTLNREAAHVMQDAIVYATACSSFLQMIVLDCTYCSTYYQALLSLRALHSGTMSCSDILVLMEQLVSYYLAMGMAVEPQA